MNKLQMPDRLTKQASTSMIVLHPPVGTTPELVKLHSGGVVRPDREGRIRVADPDDAADLERKGWRRDAQSLRDASWRGSMIAKSLVAQDRYVGNRTRTEFGDVPFEGGRVMVAHDRGADIVILHGVAVSLTEIDRDLRQSFVAAAAYFNAAQTQQEQSDAKALIGTVVDAVLRRHDFVGARVRERLQQRYD